MKKYLWIGLLAAFILLFFLLPSFATVYTDWLWFLEDGPRAGVPANAEYAHRAGRGDLRGGVRRAVPEHPHRAARAAAALAFTVFGPQGPRTIAIDMRRLRPLFYMGAAVGRVLRGALCVGSLGYLADGPQRRAVRQGRPDPGARHLVLPLPASAPSLPPYPGLHHRAAGRSSRSGLVYFAGQSLMLDPQRGLIVERQGAPSPERARRHLPARSRVPGLARHSGIPDHPVRHHSRRVVRGRVRHHARAVAAGRRVRSSARRCSPSRSTSNRRWPVHGGRGPVCRRFRCSAVSTRSPCSVSTSRRTSRCARCRSSRIPSQATRSAFALDQVEERGISGDATLTRGGHRAQRRHARERAAVERPAAARHVRADPGNPHVLRLRLGRQRPLPDRRQVSPDHAVGARAELRRRCRAARGSTSGSPSRTATASRWAR